MYGNHGSCGELELRCPYSEQGESNKGSVGESPTNYSTGFHHIFGTPKPEEQHLESCRGKSMSKEEMTNMLSKLAMHCVKNQVGTGNTRDWENGRIPSGYVYLFQLICHDMMQTASARPPDGRGAGGPVSFRRTGLELETIYGGGPNIRPICYDAGPAAKKSAPKMKLKLGSPNSSLHAKGKEPLRDLPRSQESGNSGMKSDLFSQVLIADPRNDDNSILSQTTTLFHMFHNIVVSSLHSLSNGTHKTDTVFNTQRDFERARQVVIRTYRSIIKNDFLARILHPEIYQHYENEGENFRERNHAFSVPLEFAHGVARVGHAMLRPKYKLHDRPLNQKKILSIIKTTSSRSPARMPLTDDWIIQWSHFFDMRTEGQEEYPEPNLSAKISPHMVAAFLDPDLIPSPSQVEQGERGIFFRDFLRGVSSNLWSVKGLQEKLRDLGFGSLIKSSKLLNNDQFRKKAIMDWLEENETTALQDGGYGIVGSKQASILAEDPPLLFYTLLEAEVEEGGSHLGILGSIIAAEAIWGALCRPISSNAMLGEDQKTLIDNDCRWMFQGCVPSDMPTLLRFISSKSATLPIV